MIVQVIDQQTNTRRHPSENIERCDSIKEIFDLVYKVIRLMSSIYVATIAESVSRFPFDAVVIWEKRVKNKTERN